MELDAFRGTVTLLRQEAPLGNGHAAAARGPDVIGAQAYNLGVVRALGFEVPAFEVLAFDALDVSTGAGGLAYGASLATLYQKCAAYQGRRGGFVLAVKDVQGGVSGR